MRYRLKKDAMLTAYPLHGDVMAYSFNRHYEAGHVFGFEGADDNYVFLKNTSVNVCTPRERFDDLFELCGGSTLEEAWRAR